MIQIELSRDLKNQLTSFCVRGHAGFREAGSDIVCAAISILTINTVNAIEKFTEALFDCDQDEEEGYLYFALKTKDKEAILLLQAFELGVQQVVAEYGSYVKVQYQEER